jgi:transcriptional regulator with XRE-family HTH domain
MDRAYLLEVARRAAGLTQAELAARAGTSQAALSAYERGVKSPTIKVAGRILEAAGYDLNLRRLIDWVEHEAPGVGRFWVPNILWHAEMPGCFATLTIVDPEHEPPIWERDMHDRAQRKEAYEHLILQGVPEEMIRWIDGPFLVDLWDELDLPEPVRKAWRWRIVIAREPTKPDRLRVPFGADASYTGLAWIRGEERLPPKPPKPKGPRVRFVRTRFDPRPIHNPSPEGRTEENGGGR